MLLIAVYELILSLFLFIKIMTLQSDKFYKVLNH